MAGFLDQPTLLRNSDAHLPPPAITTFTRYSGSTGARRPFHPARTPLAAALNTHLGSVSGRSTASRSSSCASAARSAAANSWCTSPAKRSKSCSAAGCSVSRRSSAFNSLTIWCSWSLLLVAPWGPLSERGFLDIPNQLYPKECCPSSPAQLNSPTRLIDHHELHHRKRRSTRARRATSLRVTLCHRRPSNVSWNPLYPLESLNSRPTPKCQGCGSLNITADRLLYGFHARGHNLATYCSAIRVVCNDCAVIQFLDANVLRLDLSNEFLRPM